MPRTMGQKPGNMTRFSFILLLSVTCGACGGLGFADETKGAFPPPPLFDVPRPDLALDDALFADAGPQPVPDVGDVANVFEDVASKDDEKYIVPTTLSRKTNLALGKGTVAWVEEVGPEDGKQLVLWRLQEGEEPEVLDAPYLNDPHGLVLDDDWLFYVDNVWGDEDVFGLRLSDGAWRLVAGGPGAQILGDALGGRVLFTDCSACVAGTESEDASEIFQINVSEAGPPIRLSNNDTNDAAPVFGTLADGTSAVAWISDYTRLTVSVGDLTSTVAADADFVQSVALVGGRIAWRPSPAIINPDSMMPSPMIINPDSMMPSDVYLTDMTAGTTTALTEHSEVGPGTPILLEGAGSNVAFAEGILDSARERVRVISLEGLLPEVVTIEEAGISEITIGSARMVLFVSSEEELGDSAESQESPRPGRGQLEVAWLLDEELVEIKAPGDKTGSGGDIIGQDLRLPPGVNAVVEVVAGQDSGRVYRFVRGNVAIGRRMGEIPLTDAEVSRRHAVVEVFGQEMIFLRDLGSTNGTYHNGMKVGIARLKSGDTIGVGKTVMKLKVTH